MPIDFSLSPEQRAVRKRARDLARDVLTAAREATHHLATPEERFVASRPHYRALVRAGLLRRLIPPPLDERYGRSGQPIAVAGRRGQNQIARRASRLR